MRKQLLSSSCGRIPSIAVSKIFRICTVTITLFFSTLFYVSAQDQPVTGRIVSADGEGIPGVTVVVKGTSTGTVTDSSGNYSISAPSDAILVYSYLGYVSQEVPVGSQSTMNITLASDSKADEVVVIGYGTQKRKEVTGSVGSVSGEDIRKMPVSSFDQAMQGRIAGVNVTQSSGAPGAAVSVQIRGGSAISATRTSEPLYIIDGFIVQNDNNATDASANGRNAGGNTNALSTINASDIESIEVLKDAAAAAVYGARAGNGVVIITTKRGMPGKTKINYETYTGVQKVWKTLDLLDAQQNATLNNEAHLNSIDTNYNKKLVAAYADPASLGKGTDWQKEMFRTAPIRNHYLSLQGGSKTAHFFVSGGYFKQEGTMIGTGFNRATVKINSDIKAGKKFKFGESLILSRTWNQREPWTQDRSQIEQMIKMTPNNPVYNSANEGGFAGPSPLENDAINPVAQAKLLQNISNRSRVMGSVYGEFEILKNLKYKLNVGADYILGTGYQFTPTFFMATTNNNNNSNASLFQFSNTSFSRLLENTLSYNKKLGKNDIAFVGGYTEQAVTSQGLDITTNGLPSNNVKNPGSGAGGSSVQIGGINNEYAIRSLFGRVNYAFNEKYLLSASMRRDGSSNFGPHNRYGVFSSVSAGWIISNENFMANVKQVSNLKLRGSWGQLGNDNIGAYQYSNTLATGANYLVGGTLANGLTSLSLGNPNIKWETTKTTNIGIDLGLFTNKIIFTADYFVKNTTGLLVQVPLPMSFGVPNAPYQNAGDVRNKGIELALRYQKNTGDLQYSFGANFTSIRNRVTSLGGSAPIEGYNNASAATGNITRTEVGQPIGYFYGYKTAGIFQSDAEVAAYGLQPNAKAGDIKFVDTNGDGKLDANDRVKIGSALPKFTYGFNAAASYKGFDINMFFQGVYGNDIYNLTRYWTENMGGTGNFNNGAQTLNHWSPTNTNTDIPRAVSGDPNGNLRVSDRFVEKGSYLRLKNIQIGYTIPNKAFLTNLGVSKIRVYVSSLNLFTITKYSGFDPEVAPSNQNNLSRGIDFGNYPQARSFLVGLQVGF
jgi:TonB-dependent starch-binding outer membrane protein SusC